MTSRRNAESRGATVRGGLPLAEIIVVVLIVGVLAAVAVPHLLAQERRAVDVSMKADLRAIAQQLQAARLDDGASHRKVAFASPTLTLGTTNLTMAPGNTPRIFRKSRERICVQITNPEGTDGVRGFVWKSDAGGLQAAGQTCAGYRKVVL